MPSTEHVSTGDILYISTGDISTEDISTEDIFTGDISTEDILYL